MASEKERHISDSRTVSLPNNHSKASKSTFPDLIHLYCIARAATWFRGSENTKKEIKLAASVVCMLLRTLSSRRLEIAAHSWSALFCHPQLPEDSQESRVTEASSSNSSVSFHLLSLYVCVCVCVWERILRMTVTEKCCKVMKAHIESNCYCLD